MFPGLQSNFVWWISKLTVFPSLKINQQKLNNEYKEILILLFTVLNQQVKVSRKAIFITKRKIAYTYMDISNHTQEEDIIKIEM